MNFDAAPRITNWISEIQEKQNIELMLAEIELSNTWVMRDVIQLAVSLETISGSHFFDIFHIHANERIIPDGTHYYCRPETNKRVQSYIGFIQNKP